MSTSNLCVNVYCLGLVPHGKSRSLQLSKYNQRVQPLNAVVHDTLRSHDSKSASKAREEELSDDQTWLVDGVLYVHRRSLHNSQVGLVLRLEPEAAWSI